MARTFVKTGEKDPEGNDIYIQEDTTEVDTNVTIPQKQAEITRLQTLKSDLTTQYNTSVADIDSQIAELNAEIDEMEHL